MSAYSIKALKRFGSSVVVGCMIWGSHAHAQSGVGDLPDRIKTSGKIVVGVEATYPPMAYKDPATDERIGFNIDFVAALAQDMQLEIEWEEMGFAQLMPSLTSKRIDMIGTAISDYPSRRDALTFVDYLSTGAQAFVLASRSGEFNSESDLCGMTVGAPRTTSYYPEVQEWSDKNCIAAGKPAIAVSGTAGATATRLDLKQGRIDAAVLGPEYIAYLMQDEPDTYAYAGNTLNTALFGMAFVKEDTVLRDFVAASVQKLMENGTYAQILQKYGLERQAMREVAIDAGK